MKGVGNKEELEKWHMTSYDIWLCIYIYIKWLQHFNDLLGTPLSKTFSFENDTFQTNDTIWSLLLINMKPLTNNLELKIRIN